MCFVNDIGTMNWMDTHENMSYPDFCQRNPALCKNSGVCQATNNDTAAICHCLNSAYSGQNCEIGKHNQIIEKKSPEYKFLKVINCPK